MHGCQPLQAQPCTLQHRFVQPFTSSVVPHRSLPQELTRRADEEVALLPFASETAAHAAIDARNARYRLSIPWAPAAGDASPDRDAFAGEGEGPYSPNTISERLVKAEKAAEQFVARRLQPAVQRTAGLVKETSPEGVVQGLKSSECSLVCMCVCASLAPLGGRFSRLGQRASWLHVWG